MTVAVNLDATAGKQLGAQVPYHTPDALQGQLLPHYAARARQLKHQVLAVAVRKTVSFKHTRRWHARAQLDLKVAVIVTEEKEFHNLVVPVGVLRGSAGFVKKTPPTDHSPMNGWPAAPPQSPGLS